MIPYTMKPMTNPAKPAGALPATAAPKTVNTRIAVPMTSAANPTREAGVGIDPDRAQTKVRRVIAGQDDQRQPGTDERADELSDDVPAAVAAVDLAGRQQGDRDGRVDVASADVADRVDRREDRECERERDGRQTGGAVDAGAAGKAVRKTVSGTEPAPMKTRIAVPMASAVSFWDKVGDDIRCYLLRESMGQPAWLTYGASSAWRAARAASASGPSAARVISDDGRIVIPSRAMRLFASASRPS